MFEHDKAILRWSKKDADKNELGKMFAAVDESYNLTNQYKYTWNTLQNYGQLRDTRIWPNFLNFIEWMENEFSKERFYEVMGKSYDLDDNVLIRCDDEKFRGIEYQKWLISSMFRHVENPDRDLMGKYVGKIRFEKKYKEGEPNEVEDIIVTILNKNGQKRDYYQDDSLDLIDKTIPPPKWLNYDPSDPDYESLKASDPKIFEFLKTKDFSKCQHQSEGQDDNDLPLKDFFEIDCSQLLGIGGEAVVIRLDKSKKVRRAPDEDSRDEAIKIIPIDKLPSEYQQRVIQRQEQVLLQEQEEAENAANEDRSEAEIRDSRLKKLESVELNDDDAELAEFNSTNLKHPSLMDYSNVQLDFIKVFGEKKFVMVIVMPYYDASAWDYLKYAATQPSDFFPIQSRMEMTERILEGIIYMHENDTCHRDIKLRRVFIMSFLCGPYHMANMIRGSYIRILFMKTF